MKKCPTCNRTFTDDALSFCLDDGSPLLSADAGSVDSYNDPGATMQFTPARDTSPPQTEVYPPSQPPGFQAAQQASWSPTPQSGASWDATPQVGGLAGQPPKKSKAAYWILGVVALLVVLGIGGVVLALVLVGMSDSNTNNSNNSNEVANNSNSNSNSANSNNANNSSETTSSKAFQVQEDFSRIANWWTGANAFGKAEYVDGEYRLSAAGYGGYVAVYSPKRDEYHTENVTTRVTVRSVTGVSPSLGYGLTVHGEMKSGNLEDYGFLIRTDDNQAYRVVLHRGGKESTLINWTRSTLIRQGSTPNQLEARASGDRISFYINGQYATSVSDKVGYMRGIVGFYASDTAPIAFDDLEIYK